MISIFFDFQTVYYNFDEILQLMINYNFERADKKMLNCNRLKIICANEQVYFTNGTNIDIRLVKHDECYVSFEGILELMDSNMFGEKDTFETLLVNCTFRVVLQPNHPWLNNYIIKLQSRLNGSFEFYFKVLEQYMLANQPYVSKIGPIINKLIATAEKYKQCNHYCSLIEACHNFDKASALMLQHISL
nr:ORF4 [Pieris rapae granulovirus]